MKNATRTLLYILIIGLSVACQDNQPDTQTESFQVRLMAIVVEDLEVSLKWYSQVLGGTLEKPIDSFPDYDLRIAFLQVGDFHLELIESGSSIQRSEILPDPTISLGGWFKIGFLVQDIDIKYAELQKMDSLDFVTGIGDLPQNELPIKWPKRFFLLQDPDGNYVQFFDSGAGANPSPWLFMNTVQDLPTAISWYTSHLGFTHHETVGESGNRRAVLERDDYVIELFEPVQVLPASKAPSENLILGFSKLAFGVDKFEALLTQLKNEQIQISYGPETSTFSWANQYVIVKDEEGNWIQLFELNTND